MNQNKMISKIIEASKIIADASRKGHANYIIVSPSFLKEKRKEIESRIKVENRNNKIISISTDKKFIEKKIENDKEYKQYFNNPANDIYRIKK